MYIHVCTHIFIHVYIYIYVYVYLHTCNYICVHMRVYINVYIYIERERERMRESARERILEEEGLLKQRGRSRSEPCFWFAWRPWRHAACFTRWHSSVVVDVFHPKRPTLNLHHKNPRTTIHVIDHEGLHPGSWLQARAALWISSR